MSSIANRFNKECRISLENSNSFQVVFVVRNSKLLKNGKSTIFSSHLARAHLFKKGLEVRFKGYFQTEMTGFFSSVVSHGCLE